MADEAHVGTNPAAEISMKTPSTKTFVILVALFLATNVVFGASPPERAVIEVKGLACPFCVQGLEKHLKRLGAVAAVHTSLQKGEAVADFKPGRSASEEELRAAVKKAGFTAGRIRFESKPDETAAPEDADQPDLNAREET